MKDLQKRLMDLQSSSRRAFHAHISHRDVGVKLTNELAKPDVIRAQMGTHQISPLCEVKIIFD